MKIMDDVLRIKAERRQMEAGIEKMKVRIVDTLSTSGLAEPMCESYYDFVADQFRLAATGHWWGTKVGIVKVAYPATWWQMLKAQVYNWLEYDAEDDRGYNPRGEKIAHALRLVFGGVRYTEQRHQVRTLFPGWDPPVEAGDAPHVMVVE